MNPDIDFALLHVPSRVRPAMRALFEVDAAMGDVVAKSTEPALGRIKLAWWREQLENLDENPPPAEPRLQAVAEHLLPAGISGAEVAELESGWATLVDPEVDARLIASRGERLFEMAGRLLGGSDPMLADAGALYALASVACRGVPELREPARERLETVRRHRFRRSVRPLTMLTRAAARDLDREEPEGGRWRMAAMLAHRWSGKLG